MHRQIKQLVAAAAFIPPMRGVSFVLVLMLAATAARADGQMPPDLRPPDLDQVRMQFAKQMENMRKREEAEAAQRREQSNEIVAWVRELWWALLVAGGAAGIGAQRAAKTAKTADE
jgi:hypothetical protein